MIVEKQIRNSWDADHYMHQSARGYDVNTIIKQKKQLSRELDKKNDTLCKFMVSNVLKHFENTFLQNDIVSELSRQSPYVSKTLIVVFWILRGNFLSAIHQYLMIIKWNQII